MNILKRLLFMLISIFFILSNLLFYTINFKEYVNFRIFQITSTLLVSEVFFWLMIFYTIRYFEIYKKRNKKREIFIVEVLFLVGLIGLGVGRILMQSSPYLNDLILSNIKLLNSIGWARVTFLFAAIMFFWYSINIRNAWLIIISILNFFNAVIVWLDFDTVPSTLIRLGVGALSIGYLFFVRKSVTEDEDNEEEKDDSNDDEYYEIEYSDIKRIEEK